MSDADAIAFESLTVECEVYFSEIDRGDCAIV